MKLLFKQRFFSWLDSYDIYSESGDTVFTVQGKLSWGHKLEINDSQGNHVGTLKEEILTFLPRFAMYIEGNYIGEIKKEFTLFKPVYTLNCNGWTVDGDMFGWDYTVHDDFGNLIMTTSKEHWNWTDTYIINVVNNHDILISLMIVLAIDAVKCSQSS